MKRIFLVLAVFVLLVSPAYAQNDPYRVNVLATANVAFDTSAGVTAFSTAISLTSAMCVAVCPVGDDIYCTFDSNTTTPVKDKHFVIPADTWFLMLPSEAARCYFTGGGSAAGYVNLMTYDKWASPY